MTLLTVLFLQAQTNGNNSSYSRFGIGTLNDATQNFSKGMGGIGLGIRAGNKLNMLNPASYSAIDSITFLMDVGMDVSMGQMKNNSTSLNVTNTSLDHANIGFRLARGLGFSVGFVPYSTIGYSFSTENNVGSDFTTTQKIVSESSYNGEGGLHKVFAGAGWNPISHLSIGVNVGYVWGKYDHQLSQSFTEGGSSSSTYSGLNSTHLADIKTYSFDFGAQYSMLLDKENSLTIGATMGIGHKICNDATLTRYTSAGDSTVVKAADAFDLPFTFGLGATWEQGTKWLAGVDIRHERWGNCRIPVMSTDNNILTYTPQKGGYMNRTKIAMGAQYIPNALTGKYFSRVAYRVGANFSTPYLKVNGENGPMEYGLSAGFGLPITNNINKGTLVNLNLQWLRRQPSVSNMITENYFVINLGITFSESWFMKFKIQ